MPVSKICLSVLSGSADACLFACCSFCRFNCIVVCASLTLESCLKLNKVAVLAIVSDLEGLLSFDSWKLQMLMAIKP